MDHFEKYFQRNKAEYPHSFPDGLDMIVIVPVLDDREIFQTLESLCCCRIADEKAGVLVVVNHSEAAETALKERNRALAYELKQWIARHPVYGIRIEVIEAFDFACQVGGSGIGP